MTMTHYDQWYCLHQIILVWLLYFLCFYVQLKKTCNYFVVNTDNPFVFQGFDWITLSLFSLRLDYCKSDILKIHLVYLVFTVHVRTSQRLLKMRLNSKISSMVIVDLDFSQFWNNIFLIRSEFQVLIYVVSGDVGTKTNSIKPFCKNTDLHSGS